MLQLSSALELYQSFQFYLGLSESVGHRAHFPPKETQSSTWNKYKKQIKCWLDLFKKTETRNRMLKIIYTGARMKNQGTITLNNLDITSFFKTAS